MTIQADSELLLNTVTPIWIQKKPRWIPIPRLAACSWLRPEKAQVQAQDRVSPKNIPVVLFEANPHADGARPSSQDRA